jgi:hypothetical protein
MGWTQTKVSSNITTKKYIRHTLAIQFKGKFDIVETIEGKIVDGCKAFYLSLRDDDGVISAIVVLTRRKNGFIQYRIISEKEGPLVFEAPAKFIDSLSPTENKYATDWRTGCLQKSA